MTLVFSGLSTCKEANAAFASQRLKRAVHRILALQVITHGVSQLTAAAVQADAAADMRAASNSRGFEAVADKGTRQSKVPVKKIE